MMRRLVLHALALSLTSCSGAELPTEHEVAQGRSLVPVTRFRGDSLPFAVYSGFAAPERRLITDSADMVVVWSRIHAGQTSAPPLPGIDFREEMVLLAALGGRPSGGYAIRIDSAASSDGRLEAFVRQIRPAADCTVPAVLTAPVDLVRVPRLGATVSYHEQQEVRECS